MPELGNPDLPKQNTENKMELTFKVLLFREIRLSNEENKEMF
jgi:hypothetical protein